MNVITDIATLGIVLGTIIPILVALVTKRVANPGQKAVINFLLSAIAGSLSVVVAQAQNDLVNIDVSSFVSAIALTWVTSVASHYGLLKPTGVTGTNGAVQAAIPGGVGSSKSVIVDQPPDHPATPDGVL